MKLKKFLGVVLVGVLSVSSMIAFTGCGSSFDGVVNYDGNGGTLVSGREVQYLSSGKIDAPIYVKEGYSLLGYEEVEDSNGYTLKAVWGETSQGLVYTLSADETYYTWTSIGNCTDKVVIPASYYQNLPVKSGNVYCLGNGGDGVQVETLILPFGFEDTGSAPFTRSATLKTLVFSESIVSTGMAMAGASGLETVYISSSVTLLRDSTFYQCALKDVYYAGTEEEWKKIEIEGIDNEDALSGATIHFESKFDYTTLAD